MTGGACGAKHRGVDVFDEVDHRLSGELRADFERRRSLPADPLPLGVTIVLAGHRGAGKSRLLPLLAQKLGRPAVDLDLELEKVHGRPLKKWVEEDVLAFRHAEREGFRQVPAGAVVAVGGGFLSSSAEVLTGCLTVLVPVSFETYVDRLLADDSRPRLKPELKVEEELREVYFEREQRHRMAAPLKLVDFLLRAERGHRARRVVTLPPGADATQFAWAAKHDGADLLEVRTDLTPVEYDLRRAARALPLLVSERGPKIPDAWRALATLVDAPDGGDLVSFHAPAPMTTQQALAHWSATPLGRLVKHVEPLGPPGDAARLFATHKALCEVFGAGKVTVLAQGPLATPFRALLARHNALDFLALDPTWMAAPGQRLLADATREGRCAKHDTTTQRLGILGTHLGASRSPRLHPQPFDRLDLPADADVGALLSALHPHYRGFAVTNPFKKAAARAVGAKRQAVNTLLRTDTGWDAYNTDLEGALEVLLALVKPDEARRRRRARREGNAPVPGPLGADGVSVTVLGAGGVMEVLREAAEVLGVQLTVLQHASPFEHPLSGAVVWTWPPEVVPPKALAFKDAQVAVITYGPRGRAVAARVLGLGGTPKKLGHRWFIAQARRQQKLWEG